MATICRDEPSQNSWPRVFSCQAMRCRSTRAIKSAGLKRPSADLAKCGLADRKFWAVAPALVKLQRPPPEIRILRPGSAEWSMRSTRRPRCPARAAQNIPAAPAPMMIASKDRAAGMDPRLAGWVGDSDLVSLVEAAGGDGACLTSQENYGTGRRCPSLIIS